MWVAPIVFVAALGGLLVVLAHCPAPRGAPDVRERERRWLGVAAILSVPLGPAILFHLDRRLPAIAPDHWDEGIWGVWKGSSGDTWMAFAAILLLARAAIPAIAWYAAAVSAYPSASRQARGHRMTWLSAGVFVVVTLVASNRIARGGVPPEAFSELGNLTPGPFAGPELDATIEQHAMSGTGRSPVTELIPEPEPPPPPESERDPLEHNRFDWSLGSFTLCWYACEPPEPLPAYLAAWETWRPAEDDRVLLMRSRRGTIEAMLVEDVSFEPVALDVRDVWRMVRPPVWPLAMAMVLAGLGTWLSVRARRPLAATWMLQEATTVVVFAYATYVGM